MHLAQESEERQDRRQPRLDAIAGAFAGCVARFLLGPLDVVKIRFQVQIEPISANLKASRLPAHYTGFANAFATIIREEGIQVCPHALRMAESPQSPRVTESACCGRGFGGEPFQVCCLLCRTQLSSSWHYSNVLTWSTSSDFQVNLHALLVAAH